MGTCSPNSESSSCSGGQFYSDATCTSVGECDYGCCQIGTQVLYTRQITCYQRAQTRGSQYQWSAGTESQCTVLQSSSSNVYGACVKNLRYSKTCSYTTQSQCANGNFSAGMFCSNSNLGLNCSRTENTTCFNEDVHYLDSCGNVDEVKSDCNYASGSICRQESTNNAICRNLNCDNGKNNGERWCTINTDIFSAVGSRYFSQYCLNGEVFTEPCDDYRQEYCITEPFKDIYGDERSVPFTEGNCKNNPWDECMAANVESMEGVSSSDQPTVAMIEERKNKLKETCESSDFCQLFGPGDLASNVKKTILELDGTSYSDPSYPWRTITYAKEGLTEDAKANYEALNLELCFPILQPGFDIASSFSSSDESACSQGDFTQEVVFRHDRDSRPGNDREEWGLDIEDPANDEEQNLKLMKYAAMTTGLRAPYWYDWEQIWTCTGDNEYCKLVAGFPAPSTLPVNPDILSLLNDRCRALGDCAGKVNYVGVEGAATESNEAEMLLVKNEGWRRTYKFTYTCSPWKASSESEDCQRCGENNLPCSEYSCQSLGENCEYNEPAGADKGYCMSSNDNSPPTISYSLNPASPVPPYSSLEITVNTNEDSICAFNLGSAGSKFEEMQYELGNGSYSRQHKVVLNVPGVLPANNDTSYDLITQDGKYEMYVRCEDPAGNWNLAASLINFEVMQTPDTLPPVIQSITPSSGSYLPYNVSQKEISIKLNEPSECKWSATDQDYASMENNFVCDNGVTDYGLINGYFCNGIITNVTLNLSQQSKYFIRCKDQPWLEGNESELYSRNVNPASKEYILKPSTYLTVTGVTPNGDYIIGPGASNFTLSAKTSGGPESGKSSCSWKYTYKNIGTVYYPFTNTNSSVHSVSVTNISEGNYNFQIKCTDIAGNYAYKNSTVSVSVDNTAPLISRIYNDKGNLKLYTDEGSVCKYMFAGGSPSCLFSLNSGNLTAMYGTSSLEHTTPWKKGFTYLIKCADFYGNENSDCGMIVKTY